MRVTKDIRQTGNGVSTMRRTAFASLGLTLFLASCGTHVERTTGTGTTDGPSTLNGQVLPVRLSAASGYYPAPISVTAVTDTPGASIFCTQDGTDPTSLSALYIGPIPVARSMILRCRALRADMIPGKIAEALYVIDGSPPDGDGMPPFHFARIEINLLVDGSDEIRVQDAVMDLIHVSGDLPSGARAIITYPDGSVRTFDSWDAGTAIDLGLTDFAAGGLNYIPRSSLIKDVGRGSITVDDRNRVVIVDWQREFSAYGFVFEYWYQVAE